MMINPRHSGYIGTVDRIKELYHEFSKVPGEHQSVLIEAIQAIEAMEPKRTNDLLEFFKNTNIKFPKSYQDLWLSGIVEIMRSVNYVAYFYGYEQYIYPEKATFISQEPYFSESVDIIKCITDDCDFSEIDYYYKYPSDEYLHAIGPESEESLRTAIVVASNNIAGNGGLGLIYQNSFSADGESEVSILNYSEGAIFRFRSFAEVFFTWSFSGLINGIHCPSQEDLLRINNVYSLIFKS